MVVGGRDVGATILEPLPVNRGLHGNWALFLKDVGYQIVSARAYVNDDADRGRKVGGKRIAQRSDRADSACRTANCDDSPSLRSISASASRA